MLLPFEYLIIFQLDVLRVYFLHCCFLCSDPLLVFLAVYILELVQGLNLEAFGHLRKLPAQSQENNILVVVILSLLQVVLLTSNR